MKNYYFVSFKWYDSTIFCSNIVLAENKDIVEKHYSEKYGWCSVRDIQCGELDEAKRKGMPIIKL